MRAPSSPILALILGGCLGTSPAPAPVVVAPLPKLYTCEQQRQLAAEYRALPPGSMLRIAVNDYGEERDRLRAAHGLAEPPPCPK